MKKGRSLENGNMNQIYAAKTNHITNPVGFLLNPVVFSWKVRECRGKNQRCARILVAKDETFADVLWDLRPGAYRFSAGCPSAFFPFPLLLLLLRHPKRYS